MKYAYYYFGFIARGNANVQDYDNLRTRFEFYKNGLWVKDEERSLHLSDAMMDYGDYSPSDYDELTEEQAKKRIAELDKKERQ